MLNCISQYFLRHTLFRYFANQISPIVPQVEIKKIKKETKNKQKYGYTNRLYSVDEGALRNLPFDLYRYGVTSEELNNCSNLVKDTLSLVHGSKKEIQRARFSYIQERLYNLDLESTQMMLDPQ